MAKRRSVDLTKGVRGRFFDKAVKIELASTDFIDQLSDLARELFSEVLETSFDECLVTDESDLRFFITEETPDDYEERFRTLYGFELGAMENGPIIEILKRIAKDRRNRGEPN